MIPALAEHLVGGATTMARAWALTRRDGAVLAFTDHDLPLGFEGVTFRPDAGFAARAIASGTGLSVDNTEVLGALSHDSIRDEDIDAGRYDGAEVRMWIVNWAEPAQRHLRFRGQLGEIRRVDGAFHAELRGLTEALNQPRGRVYHRDCAAVLGDATCRFDTARPGFVAEVTFGSTAAQDFDLPGLGDYADRWFERGTLTVLSGAGQGLSGLVKSDRLDPDGTHRVTLWEPLRLALAPGDRLRLVSGCDKRARTCRFKFDNFVNFQGFPYLPGDDWMIAGPRAGAGS